MSDTRKKLIELVTHWLEMPELAEPVIKNAYNARKPLPRGFTIPLSGTNSDWCACMVSEALSEILPNNPYREVSAEKLSQLMQKDWGKEFNFDYALPGDPIFFDWNNNGTADHTGFIVAIEEKNGKKYVTTIEGNINDRMYKRTFVVGEPVNGCKTPWFFGFDYGELEPVQDKPVTADLITITIRKPTDEVDKQIVNYCKAILELINNK